MAGNKKISYEIGVDSSKGVAGVKQFSSAVKKELKSVEADFDDTATAGEKVATVLSKMATDLDSELARAATAADALAAALGPDVAGRVDVGQLVGELQRMGLTFEEITADADKLATSLKEMDTVQMKGLDSGLGGVNTKFGQMDKSIGSSRSVLANMVGNATQDLGALTGVAGSAGVAIGQMGEYMADAMADGEGFGSVLSSFGKVAGPLAGISAGLFVIQGVMESISKSKALEAERVKTYSEAVEGAVDGAAALESKLEEIGKIEFKDPTKGLFGGTGDLLPTIGRLGLSIDGFSQLVHGSEADMDAYVDRLWEMREAGEISTDTYVQMKNGLNQWQDSVREGERIQSDLNDALVVTNDLAKGAFFNWKLATDPAVLYGDELERIGTFLDRAEGKIGTNFQFPPEVLRDIELVKEALGVDLPAVYDLASQAAADHKAQMEDDAQATKDAADALGEFGDKVEEWATNLVDAQTTITDIAGVFKVMERRKNALSNIFELGNTALEALQATQDVEQGIRDLHDFISGEEGVGVPDIFDPDDVNADDFLAKIESLRGPIQQRIADAFAAAGPEKAQTVANDWVARIVDELDGAMSEEQVINLLGLGDLQVQLGVALDQAQVEAVRQQLDVLTGLQGEDAYTASIALALQTGDLTPEAAEILVQAALEGAGVLIPSELDTPDTKKAKQEAEKFAAEFGISLKSEIAPPTDDNKTGVRDGVQDWYDNHPVTVPVVPVVVAGGYSYLTGGGAGGLAAPAGRSAAAPAAAATGVGMAPLRVPVAGGQKVEYHFHQSFNAGTIGAPFDVARAVEDANRQTVRLMPRNP